MKILVAAIASLLALPPCASAQKNPKTVPIEFVQSLVMVPATVSGLPDVFVGQLPPELSTRFPLPRGSRIIGSIDYRRISMSSVVVPQAVGVTRDDITSALLKGGWTPAPEPTPFSSGFVSTEGSRGITFCDQDSSSINVNVGEDRDGATRLLIMRSHGPYSVCRIPRTRDERRQSVIPLLRPPPNAQTWNRGSGGGGHEWHSTAYLRTSSTMIDVAKHYTAQLIAAGWKQVGGASSDKVSATAFELTDKEGQKWDAVFLATKIDSGTWPFLVSIRATRPGDGM